MRLLISAGGTGGGVYPALSVTKGLVAAARAGSPPTLLWIGGQGGPEAELVGREGIPFQAIHGGGVHGVGRRLLLVNAFNLLWGLGEALTQLRRFRPDA